MNATLSMQTTTGVEVVKKTKPTLRGVTGRGYRLVSLTPDLVRELTSFAAQSLLQLPTDAAISQITTRLGPALSVDRAWMFEYDDSCLRFRNTHEWCVEGVTSHVTDLQDAPVSMIIWVHRNLLAGRAVLIDEISRLPDTARPLRREMQRQSNQSVVCVPVVYQGQLRGGIGLDSVHSVRHWSDQEVEILTNIASLIAEARYGDNGRSNRAQMTEPLIYLRGSSLRGITETQIVALRSDRNRTQVYLTDGTSTYDRRSFGEWRAMLAPASFPSVHRTMIVNFNQIAEVIRNDGTKWLVRLRDLKGSWSVSRAHRKELAERLGE